MQVQISPKALEALAFGVCVAFLGGGGGCGKGVGLLYFNGQFSPSRLRHAASKEHRVVVGTGEGA